MLPALSFLNPPKPRFPLTTHQLTPEGLTTHPPRESRIENPASRIQHRDLSAGGRIPHRASTPI